MSSKDMPSTSGTERRPLMMALRVPRSYGSLFPYYKFVRDTVNDPMITEVICVYYEPAVVNYLCEHVYFIGFHRIPTHNI